MSSTFSCKDVGIRKSEFVPKTQFPYIYIHIDPTTDVILIFYRILFRGV